eukprot:TRINITY_DN15598_c0_g1_i2.p1 TRINITY_DN15598_c0_g1~~TRINITY_DN15598_c0_g1_i2.p1  ORF type:complete len:395 (+),score=36.14 TRINITY_DN15598_c0_g1_i2:123-1307(+)
MARSHVKKHGPVLASLTEEDLTVMGVAKFGWRRQLLLSRARLLDKLRREPLELAEWIDIHSPTASPTDSFCDRDGEDVGRPASDAASGVVRSRTGNKLGGQAEAKAPSAPVATVVARVLGTAGNMTPPPPAQLGSPPASWMAPQAHHMPVAVAGHASIPHGSPMGPRVCRSALGAPRRVDSAMRVRSPQVAKAARSQSPFAVTYGTSSPATCVPAWAMSGEPCCRGGASSLTARGGRSASQHPQVLAQPVQPLQPAQLRSSTALTYVRRADNSRAPSPQPLRKAIGGAASPPGPSMSAPACQPSMVVPVGVSALNAPMPTAVASPSMRPPPLKHSPMPSSSPRIRATPAAVAALPQGSPGACAMPTKPESWSSSFGASPVATPVRRSGPRAGGA